MSTPALYQELASTRPPVRRRHSHVGLFAMMAGVIAVVVLLLISMVTFIPELLEVTIQDLQGRLFSILSLLT